MDKLIVIVFFIFSGIAIIFIIWGAIRLMSRKAESVKDRLYLMMGDRASDKGKRKVSNRGEVN